MPLAFSEPRLLPLGNTFIDTEESTGRPRRNLLRQRSFPGFVPYWLGFLEVDEDLSQCCRKGKGKIVKVIDAHTFRSVSGDATYASTSKMHGRREREDWADIVDHIPPIRTEDLPTPNPQPSDHTRTDTPAFAIDDGRTGISHRRSSLPADACHGVWGLTDAPAIAIDDGCAGISHRRSSLPADACHGFWGSTDAPPLAIDDGITTLMIRNIPSTVSQKDLIDDLNSCGFRGLYDFCYMPSTFDWTQGENRGKGYAFINFVSTVPARELVRVWHLTLRFGMQSHSMGLNITAAAIQGLDGNIAKWSSPRLRRIRNQNYRPFIAGVEVAGGPSPVKFVSAC